MAGSTSRFAGLKRCVERLSADITDGFASYAGRHRSCDRFHAHPDIGENASRIGRHRIHYARFTNGSVHYLRDAATDPKARAFLLTYAPWANAELARVSKARNKKTATSQGGFPYFFHTHRISSHSFKPRRLI